VNQGSVGMSVVLVAIVGGSGSGKTWLANKIQTLCPGRCAILRLDDFYRDLSHLPASRRNRINFDHPRAIDWPRFTAVLEAIQAGGDVRLPQYDFSTHTRSASSANWQARPLVVVEGLWLLHRRDLAARYRLRIFVDCPEALRLKRRLQRDVEERGRNRASVLRQFRDHVQPMHARYVELQRKRADLIVTSPIDAGQWGLLARSVLATVENPVYTPPSVGMLPTHRNCS
jgi:uridine kinase